MYKNTYTTRYFVTLKRPLYMIFEKDLRRKYCTRSTSSVQRRIRTNTRVIVLIAVFYLLQVETCTVCTILLQVQVPGTSTRSIIPVKKKCLLVLVKVMELLVTYDCTCK